jgi:DNA modification methylase
VTPYFQTGHVTLYVGDALAVLRELPAASVDCVVTSPPYWGLRDYKAAGQLGLEPTPAAYVDSIVEVFREVRRVMRDHATLWLNLGDSYASNGSGDTKTGFNSRYFGRDYRPGKQSGAANVMPASRHRNNGTLKPKDMVGIPWRVAFALQDDGWWLRSDIIWSKPNPMPESTEDRPGKAHEYVFLLAKAEHYYFDMEAVREDVTGGTHSRGPSPHVKNNDSSLRPRRGRPSPRNMRTVWTIPTQARPDAHFATFPDELPRRAIKAGCPEQVCATCGRARERIVKASGGLIGQSWHNHDDDLGRGMRGGDDGHNRAAELYPTYRRETIGWTDCGHDAYVPGVVLDPFAGSGTTLAVARDCGRQAIGIEISTEYAAMIVRRVQQEALAL